MKNDILINLQNISKSFGDTEVIKNLNLYIRKNEFVTLLGPSGCGKTTILRMIGGFENPTCGDIIFSDNVINKIPPHKRPIDTIFQKYALFPHMNVYDNVAFGLKLKKKSKQEIKKKVEEVLKLVKLGGYEKRSARSLSGGQQQRIAIARALANEPKVLLLDEPLGALDLKLRQGMQLELKEMQERLGITFIFVTHDQEEALTMSDTIVVLDNGKIQQVGSPEEIYNKPNNCFVAKFIGESNIMIGKIIKDYTVEFAGTQFKCEEKGYKKDEEVNIVVRPEDVILVSKEEGKIRGIVDTVTFKGVYYEMHIKENERVWKVQNINMKEVGEEVGINISPENIHIMKTNATEQQELIEKVSELGKKKASV